jgi:hypothetical protein
LSTGQLLDAREVRDYHQGKLLTWIVRGGVRFTIKRLQGNAVFSGLFIDPAPPVDHWRSMLFSTSQLRNPLVSGNYMDPDGDGRQNLLEHAVGSNPLLPEVDRILWATPEHSGANDLTSVQVSYKRSRKATDVTFSLKGTSDWTQWQDVSDLFDTVEVVDNEDGETETVRLKQRDLFPGHLFLRLEVNEETY